MKDTVIHGRLEYCEKEWQDFNRTFTATLTESAAFTYGNRTAVVIEWGELPAHGGKKFEPLLLDTRYDTTLRRDGSNFEQWLRNYFSINYRAHNLKID